MSALSTRDALAKVIWEASRADEGTISATGANIVADALLTSGTVIDAATLADDEALVERLALDAQGGPYDPDSVWAVLRALATALTERAS